MVLKKEETLCVVHHDLAVNAHAAAYDFSNMGVEHRLAQAASGCVPSVEVPAISMLSKQNA